MTDQAPIVAVLVGSKSDEHLIEPVFGVLDSYGLGHEYNVISAPRDPDRLTEYVKAARGRGIKVIIAAAGGAAALPGAVAALTTLPVIGVPLPSSEMNGIDSLHAIVQMPPGIPVACVAVGSWGARNAAYLAAQMLGGKYENIRKAYDEYRESLKKRT